MQEHYKLCLGIVWSDFSSFVRYKSKTGLKFFAAQLFLKNFAMKQDLLNQNGSKSVKLKPKIKFCLFACFCLSK